MAGSQEQVDKSSIHLEIEVKFVHMALRVFIVEFIQQRGCFAIKEGCVTLIDKVLVYKVIYFTSTLFFYMYINNFR